MTTNATIAALSTPFGEGAIALLRLSGPDAAAIVRKVFQPKTKREPLPARTPLLGRIVDASGAPLDDALLTLYRAPASYTGEAMAELACHGGILLTRRVLRLLLEAGARLAEPGEFTQRAFLNGKLDLTQAEAVMDLIRAQSDLALRSAARQLEGGLGERIREIQEAVLDLLAHVEAHIDFPEEGIAPETETRLRERIAATREKIAALLRTAEQGRVLRQGLQTVISGAPNVGKSSLLNRLLGEERAIVSELPGATRDSIQEYLTVRGIPLRLVDTAGVREAAGPIEREGIARTHRHLEEADLILHLADASAPPDPFSETLASAPPDPRRLWILNKSDLGEHPAWSNKKAPLLRISCRDGSGLEALADAIFERAMGGHGTEEQDRMIAINARHQQQLTQAVTHLEAACETLARHFEPELTAIELRSALEAIGEIIGHTDSEDLLGRIFANFCIGK